MDSQPQSGVKTRLALLSELPGGARGAVHRLAGGHSFVDRLVTLGFTVGAEITVVQNYGTGPVIAMVRDVRIALGRGESAKVWVEVAGP